MRSFCVVAHDPGISGRWPAVGNERLATGDPGKAESVPESKYPMLAQKHGPARDKAFTLRLANGTEAPLDASFEAFTENSSIAGIAQYASKDE